MQFLHFAIAALTAMSMIGAVAGADDTTTSHPRASVITRDATVVEGVPVPTRKLTKNSKACKPDATKDEMIARLERWLVYAKVIDMYRSLQPSSSSEDVAARADKNDVRRRESMISSAFERKMVQHVYGPSAWDDCLDFYEGFQNSDQELVEYCQDVTVDYNGGWLFDACLELVLCPSTSIDERGELLVNTPSWCCASYEDFSPAVLPPGQAGDSCGSNSDCLPLRGSNPMRRALCRAGRCQSGFSPSFCDKNLDCFPLANLSPPHGVCVRGTCQTGRTGEYCGQGNDCVSGICRANKPDYPKKCIQK